MAAVQTEQPETVSALRELSDPDFFVYWSKVRLRYAVTRLDGPERQVIKREYEAVLAEYRRRLDG